MNSDYFCPNSLQIYSSYTGTHKGLPSLFYLSSFPFKACLVFSREYNSGLKSTQAALPAIPSIPHPPFKSSLQNPNAQAGPSPKRPEFLRAGLRHGSRTKLPMGLQCASWAQHHSPVWVLPSCLASERYKDRKSFGFSFFCFQGSPRTQVLKLVHWNHTMTCENMDSTPHPEFSIRKTGGGGGSANLHLSQVSR